MFMLEKALGPPIDFVEGRNGAASTTWIIQGALWLIPASILTFCGLWLQHDPDALHSLSSWGLSPSSSSLILAGILTASYGSGGMLLNGAAMHIVPELGGTKLASEKNASLMSLIWTLAVVVLIIGANKPEILGIKVLLIATGLLLLSGLAVIVNMLLTAASRSRKMPLPAWMMIIGMIAGPLSAVSVVISGSLDTGTGQWLATRLSASSFSLMVAGAVLYAASRGSGNPLWSRSLAAVTLAGTILTINSGGFFDGEVAANFLGVDSAAFQPSRNEVIAGSFLLALSLIPAIALSANVLATMRGDDVFMENPDSPGMPEINLAAIMLVPLSIGALFVHTDHLTGTNQFTEIQTTLLLMGVWLIFVPASLGSTLCIFPEVSGRNVLSVNRSRWAFWLMTAGSFGLIFTMMSDFSEMSLAEVSVEEQAPISNRLKVLGSILFYGTVIGSIYHCLNMISGSFRGSIVGDDSASVSSTSISSPFRLTKETTVRKILAQREGKLDTVVIPEKTTEAPGSPTEL
ncbi:MAG: hypothetical protein CMB67_02835 [Euryarchaeota archaeon]|nr:hypothetical protein [Euryarchaeota archaeon]